MDFEKEIRHLHAILGNYKAKMQKYKIRVKELEAENARLKAQLVQDVTRLVEDATMFQPNYFRINKTAFWFYHFAIADKAEYMADQVFIENGIPVTFGKEFDSPEKKYRIIFVKVRKKYGKEFLKAMRQLESLMLKNGDTDYLDFCKDVQRILRGS